MPELSTLLNRPGGLDGKTYRDYQFASLAAMDASEAPAIKLPPGVYDIAEDLTLTKPVQFAPGARIRPADGVTVHLSGGFYAGDWDHVFDLSLGGKVTGDRACYGHTTPQQFGAKADNINDDHQAIEAAIEFATLAPLREEYAWGIDVHFPPTSAGYRVSKTVIVNRTIKLIGGSPAHRGQGAVKIVGDDGIGCVMFFQSPGGDSGPPEYIPPKPYGAQRSHMQHIRVEPETAGGVDFGIIHNCVVIFEYCSAQEFRLCGFFAHAQTSGAFTLTADPWGSYNGLGVMYGNVNQSRYIGCFARLTTEGPGFAARGNNAGMVHYDECDANSNNGAGFLENSNIGCLYLHCHTAQNTWKIEHNGVFYLCIKGHTSSAESEPGVGADWRRYWATISATVKDADWALDTDYRPVGAINVCDASSPTTIIGHYSEGGIEKGIVPRAGTKVIGGSISGGRVIRHPESGTAHVYGGRLSNTPFYWQGADNDGNEFGSALGNDPTTPDLFMFGHNADGVDKSVTTWKLTYQATRNGYSLIRAGTTRVMEMSGTGWSQGGYSGVGHIAFQQGILVGAGGTSSTYVGIKAVTNFAAITGEVVRGQVFLYQQPTAGGKVGAVVITGGTVGSGAVLKEFGAIDP